MGNGLKRGDYWTTKHLQAAWDRAGTEGVDRHLAVAREARIFDLLRKADPADGKYLGWLSEWRRRCWRSNGLSSTVGPHEWRALAMALHTFNEALPRLQYGARDVGRYRTVDDLLDAVHGMDAGSERYAARVRELAQTVVLFDVDGWRLIRLDGPDAARRWGRDTRWCTARSVSAYQRYRLAGDLLVLHTPTGRFQLATSSREFRDADDHPASLSAILSSAPEAFVALVGSAVARAPTSGYVRRIP